MQFLTNKIKTFIQEILRHKVRLAAGMLAAVVLFALSVHFLYEGEINKRFFIFTALCLAVGFFIICPRLKDWRLSLPVVIAYLAFVPKRMFERIELPVHDLSVLRSGAQLVNILIILLVFAVLLLVFQRVNLALSVGSTLILVMGVANYFIALYRNSFLSLNDITAVGTAATVVESYDLTPSAELWYTVLYFLFWC